MGDLRLNNTSYSNNGTGVLMLNGVNYTGGGGGGESEDPEFCPFCNEYITLPFALNSNHKIYLDYEIGGYMNQMQILGNTAGNTQNFYHGMYNNNLYVYTNNGERNFTINNWKDRHELIVNDNGRVIYDGVDRFAGTPNTNSNINYTIGYRGSGVEFYGKVYRFYIYDTTTDQYICDLRPTLEEGELGLKDIINNATYVPAYWN